MTDPGDCGSGRCFCRTGCHELPQGRERQTPAPSPKELPAPQPFSRGNSTNEPDRSDPIVSTQPGHDARASSEHHKKSLRASSLWNDRGHESDRRAQHDSASGCPTAPTER